MAIILPRNGPPNSLEVPDPGTQPSLHGLTKVNRVGVILICEGRMRSSAAWESQEKSSKPLKS